jgi:3-oxoacyl-[acyl-carrier-protein] synthase-3
VLQQSRDAGRGVIYSSLYADGNGWQMLHCLPGSRHPLTADAIAMRKQYMQIRGREVYKFAVQRFAELIQDAMHKCKLEADDVKLIIPHQVNLRIIDAAMERLAMPRDKAFVNIHKYGNTSAASIPIALDEAWREGRISVGDVVIFAAFGAGLTWANAVVRV